MNLGSVTKFDKRNRKMSKNFDADIMSANCHVIVIFPIYGRLIWINPEAGFRTQKVCKSL